MKGRISEKDFFKIVFRRCEENNDTPVFANSVMALMFMLPLEIRTKIEDRHSEYESTLLKLEGKTKEGKRLYSVFKPVFYEIIDYNKLLLIIKDEILKVML